MKMVRQMSDKTGIDVISRRAVLRSALSAGVAALAAPALAQSSMDQIINAPRRGNWDDQFDAQATRAAVSVTSNSPILGPNTVTNVEQAIGQYQLIVANGGWQPVPQTQKPLQLGAVKDVRFLLDGIAQALLHPIAPGAVSYTHLTLPTNREV